MAKPQGYVLYQGPSLFDGRDVVVVATLKSRGFRLLAEAQQRVCGAGIYVVQQHGLDG